MKHEEIPGYTELRKQLTDARVVEFRAATEEERLKANKEVGKIRQEMAKLLFQNEEKEKRK